MFSPGPARPSTTATSPACQNDLASAARLWLRKRESAVLTCRCLQLAPTPTWWMVASAVCPLAMTPWIAAKTPPKRWASTLAKMINEFSSYHCNKTQTSVLLSSISRSFSYILFCFLVDSNIQGLCELSKGQPRQLYLPAHCDQHVTHNCYTQPSHSPALSVVITLSFALCCITSNCFQLTPG